jgi:hypothetical protein
VAAMIAWPRWIVSSVAILFGVMLAATHLTWP